MEIKTSLRLCVGTAAALLLTATAVAQEAEDSSAAFRADKESLGAALGLPAPESTVITRSDGTTGAVVGLSAMKMLVVRQNPDGSVSYGHAANQAEADAFVEAAGQSGPAEE